MKISKAEKDFRRWNNKLNDKSAKLIDKFLRDIHKLDKEQTQAILKTLTTYQ